RDEGTREKSAGDLRVARTAAPLEKLANDEDVGEWDEDRVADERRGIRERRPIGRGDRIVIPPQPGAARGLDQETEKASDEEHQAQEEPGPFLDTRDRSQHLCPVV